MTVAAACAVGPTRTGLSAEDVRDLVPAASAVRMETLDEIVRLGAWVDPRKLPEMPLSLLLLSVRIDRESEDLRSLPAADGAEPEADLWVVVTGGRATVFPAECLREVEVLTNGDRATGKFRFRREGLGEGLVEFSAERIDDRFRIVEFRLPAVGATTRLGADGLWRWSERR
jgi:hypothetical protein